MDIRVGCPVSLFMQSQFTNALVTMAALGLPLERFQKGEIEHLRLKFDNFSAYVFGIPFSRHFYDAPRA